MIRCGEGRECKREKGREGGREGGCIVVTLTQGLEVLKFCSVTIENSGSVLYQSNNEAFCGPERHELGLEIWQFESHLG